MLRMPTVGGVIDRRILINYRVDPDAIRDILPDPFEPLLVRGNAIAGICLIRLKELSPFSLPGRWGFSSENAAHRIAVTWGDSQRGVYIPRRDTSSRLNTLVGGRLFPGHHHYATFDVDEHGPDLHVWLHSDDGETYVEVDASEASSIAETSVFSSLEDASSFFEMGSIGYSATNRRGRFDGLELVSHNWDVLPLAVTHVRSSFFERDLPAGAAEFDNALLMRGISHEWKARKDLVWRA